MAENIVFLQSNLAPREGLPDIGERKGHAQGMLSAKDLVAKGSPAGDKRGYKYPLGGIWKEKRICC